MNVIVIGATGSIGKLAVAAMLAAGHRVTAFARHAEGIEIDNENLTPVAGDAMSLDDLSAAIAGHDAVVVTLGSGMSRKSAIRSKGTLMVIRAMQETGVTRLICQSTLGAHESWGNLNFWWKRVMFGALLKPVFRDHELQEMLVRASGLDWTIVRPSAFAEGPATGAYKEDFGPAERQLALKISREDIANFLTRQITDTRYRGRAVGISY